MTENGNGAIIFDDIYELNYELISALDLVLRDDGTLWDPITNSIIAFNGAIIKASIYPDKIHYPGQGDIAFDILSNIKLITYIFGAYIQKKVNNGMSFFSWFPEEYIDAEDIKYSNLTVKFDNTNQISTPYYHNKCLKFINMIFLLEEDIVDLSNFDNIDDV